MGVWIMMEVGGGAAGEEEVGEGLEVVEEVDLVEVEVVEEGLEVVPGVVALVEGLEDHQEVDLGVDLVNKVLEEDLVGLQNLVEVLETLEDLVEEVEEEEAVEEDLKEEGVDLVEEQMQVLEKILVLEEEDEVEVVVVDLEGGWITLDLELDQL